MKKYWKYLAFAAVVLLGTTACDDDDASGNIWDKDYVYFTTEHLGQSPVFSFTKIYDIPSSSLVDASAIEVPLIIALQREAKRDITVTLTSDAGKVLGENASALSLPESVVIPAGELRTTATATLDPSFMTTTADAAQYVLTVRIAGADGGFAVSPLLDKVGFDVTKAVRSTGIKEGTPGTGSKITDCSGWTTSNSGGWRGNDQVPVGNTSSDFARDGNFPAWFSVDMGRERTLTGCTWNNYGPGYSPKTGKFEFSTDGKVWTESEVFSLGRSNFTTLSFTSPVKARYVRFWTLTCNSGTVSYTQWYLFGTEE